VEVTSYERTCQQSISQQSFSDNQLIDDVDPYPYRERAPLRYLEGDVPGACSRNTQIK
jgi:hypothetical protein